MYNSRELTKNILATVAYYDIFSYALTSFEIWKYLLRSDYFNEEPSKTVSYSSVRQELRSENLKRFISQEKGFYFIKGKEHLVEERIERSKISSNKIRKLSRTARWLRYLPFVRMICITGGLAMKNAHHKSDWDLFIMTKSGKIWTGRTVVTLFLHLLGKRRHGRKITDRFCLNYFVSEDGMEIKTKDLFSSSEYQFMFPIYGFEYFKKFRIKNSWIQKIRPNYYLPEIIPFKCLEDSFLSLRVRVIAEAVFGFRFIENFLKKIEKIKISKNPKTYQEGGLVSATDEALVFLPELKGPIVFDKFKEKIEELMDISPRYS